MNMILSILIVLISIVTIEASHFNGGTITWVPVNPNATGSSVVITIIQSYSWVLSEVDCENNVPISTSDRTDQNMNLTCVAGCSNDGGYSSRVVDILTDCVSSSTSLNMMKSRRAKNITLNIGAYFTIAFRDGNWRTLENTNNGRDWSIASLIDLRRQPDGIINTPPTSDVASPQYVIVNRLTQIRIPVFDANPGDDVRCRWAADPGPTSVDECGSVCFSNDLPPGTTITNCVLSFRGTSADKWYAITLQIEDFISTTSTTPMSSVPVQFLIHVLPTPQCSELPIILPLTNCLEVQVGRSVNLTLFAMNPCNRSRTIITDISISMGISGMNNSRLFNATTNTSLSFITLQWVPQSGQIGPQEFCTIAYTNEKVQSEEYCATFIVKAASDFCQTTTTTTTSTTSRTTTTTTRTTSTTTTSTTTTTTTSRTTTTTTKTTTTTTTSFTTTSSSSTSTSSTSTSTTTSFTTTSSSSTSTSSTSTTTTTSFTTTSSSSTSTSSTSTSTSTTSATTITSTTTAPASSPINILLIVGLSLLALLLSICCCSACLWYYYFRGLKTRRRRKYNDQESSRSEKYLSKDQNNLFASNERNIDSNRFNTSFRSLPNDASGTRSLGMRSSIRTQHSTTAGVNLAGKRSETTQSVTLQFDPVKHKRSFEKLPKFQRSVVSVHPLNKMSPSDALDQMNMTKSLDNLNPLTKINPASDMTGSMRERVNPLMNESHIESSRARSILFSAVTVKKIKRPAPNKNILSTDLKSDRH